MGCQTKVLVQDLQGRTTSAENWVMPEKNRREEYTSAKPTTRVMKYDFLGYHTTRPSWLLRAHREQIFISNFSRRPRTAKVILHKGRWRVGISWNKLSPLNLSGIKFSAKLCLANGESVSWFMVHPFKSGWCGASFDWCVKGEWDVHSKFFIAVLCPFTKSCQPGRDCMSHSADRKCKVIC